MSLILTENRYLRFFSFALFYLAQGLPIGLISIALPAYLAEQGASAGQVASFVAISGLPWAFKLFAGPIMDRFSFLPMGRRRPWVILAQTGLVLAVASLSFISDPVGNLVLLTWLAFTVNLFAAVQDVAVDGMAIDVLPFEERGRGNAFMAFGQVAGYSGSAAVCALALTHFGVPGAAVVLTIGVGVILTWAILVRERDRERLLPWTEGEATARAIELQADNWAEIFVNLVKVMFLPASILLMVMTLCWRAADGFWITAAPIVVTQTLGHASLEYSNWNAIAGLVAAVIGLLLGPLIDRSGAQRILIVSILGYGATCFVIGFSTHLWTEDWFPVGAMFSQALFAQGVFISFIAIHMNLCWQQVSATQFAIYMAWANLCRSIGAAGYGIVEPYLTAEGQEFILMGVFCVLGAGIALVVNLKDHQARLERLDEERSGHPSTA